MLQFGELEVETAKKEISEAKDDAISEIKQEIEKQKESVAMLTRDANVTSEKIEKQKSEIDTLVKTAQELEKEIVKRKEETLLLSRDTKESKKEIESLNMAAQQIALTLVKATYLTLSTKNEFGTSPRLKTATQEIENDINRILPIVIPDSEERSQWVNNLKNILPPRN
jgi:chromosome segregation ATPase